MSISESLVAEFDAELENTRKVLAAIPDGQWDWKPHEKSMNLQTLAGHLAEMGTWGSMTINQDHLVMGPNDYKPFLPNSSEELLSGFTKMTAEFRQALINTSDEAMGKTWSMTWGGQKVMELPRLAVLRNMVMHHMIHHRGQLTVYLRLLNVKVPGTYGPTADDRTAG